MVTTKSIYQQVVEAGIMHDHHESDLYIPVNGQTLAMVKAYEFKGNVTTFTSQIDGKLWFDVPFAYEPFWDKVSQRVQTPKEGS